MLGFDAPSFTYGTDLLLPSSANKELRAELHIDDNEAAAFSDKDELPELPSVPQVSHPAVRYLPPLGLLV